MTPLKPSEKRLLTAFGVAGFLLLNLLGYSWLKKRNVVLERQRITLQARANELQIWQGRAAEAELKRAFLDQHLQTYPDEAFRETYLDGFIQTVAADLGLEVRKNQPKPVKLEPHFHKSVYTAEVSGEWDNVLQFIYRLQSPKDFRFVPSIRLKSQKKEGSTDEAANVVCTLDIEKWWSPESAVTGDTIPDEAGATTEAAPPAAAAAIEAPAPAAAATAEAVAPAVEAPGAPAPTDAPVDPQVPPPAAPETPKTAAAEQTPGTPVKSP